MDPGNRSGNKAVTGRLLRVSFTAAADTGGKCPPEKG